MNSSEIISLVALIFSIIAGVANYLYTKKSFEASNYPLLQIELNKDRSSEYGTTFSVDLTNLSSNTSIADTTIFFYLVNPMRKWKFWKKKWLLYFQKGGPDIAPLIYGENAVKTGEYIEDFLEKNAPDYIKRVEVQITTVKSSYKSYYYHVINPRHLELLLLVTYKPGIHGAKIKKISKNYFLLPHVDSKGKFLYWAVDTATS